MYTTLNLYIHPAETHRILKFLFHRMGRLVPAHKEPPYKSNPINCLTANHDPKVLNVKVRNIPMVRRAKVRWFCMSNSDG